MSRFSAVGFTACTVAIILITGTLTPASATPIEDIPPVSAPESSTAPVTGADEATVDEHEALALAVSSGEPIVVDEFTTPVSQISALPNGEMQYEISSVPVRTEDGDGGWEPINTDLVLRDGWWEPAASATPVRFNAGGTDELDQVRTPSGDWLTESWPHGALPAPDIDGPTATYVEVLPGVDLKLTATELGLASVYVVKSPTAATSEVLTDLHVILEGADVSKEAEGTFTAESASGDSITASSPLWWDSSDGGTYVSPGEENPAMPVAHTFSDTGINMDVSETIEQAQPTYPIFIDPDWSAGPTAAWYTDAAYPNQSYLSAGQSDILRVGRYDPYRGNMFFEFGIGALAGKQVLSAQLSTTQLGWAACPNSPLQVRTFGPQTAGFTWNQQNHSLWGPVLDTKNPGSCGSGAEIVGWNVSAGVQAKVGQSTIQFGFAPQDENVSSRRHYSRAATLYVSYNSPPNTPTNLRMASPVRACSTNPNDPAWLGGTNIAVNFEQTDPDPGNVDTNVYLAQWDTAAGGWGAFNRHYSPGLGAQGTKSVIFDGLSAGLYAWKARGSDWIIDGTNYSPVCYFRIDNSAPAAPTVTTTATTFTIGQPVTVAVSGASDVAGYEYWLAYSGATTPAQPAPVAVSRTAALPDCQKRVGGTRFACGTGATPVNITAAPVDALSTLWVAAYDKAGNVSTAKPLKLFTATGTPASRDPRVDTGHAWMTTSMIDPLPSVIDDSNYNTPLPLYLPTDSGTWQSVTELRPGYTVPVLRPHEPPNPGDAMITPGQGVDAKESFSLAMWVNPTNASQPSTQYIAVQGGSNRTVSLELQSGKYRFCIASTPGSGDAATLVSGCVTAPTNAVTGDWVLLTGIWDSANQQLRLDVGDSSSPVAVTPHKLSTATGTFPSGELMIGPPPTSLRFAGLIANPVIVPGVMDSRQLGSLAGFSTPFTY